MEGKEVRTILQRNGVSLVQLAEKLGISPQGLNSRLNAREFKRSYLIELAQILGTDYFGVTDTPHLAIATSEDDTRQPIIDVRVCAGNGIGLEGDENTITEYVSIPSLRGCTGLTVYGESMYPLFKPGDVVFVREVRSTLDIDFGRTYLIITRNDRLLKMLYQSSLGDKYVCIKSYNQATTPAGDRRYPDRDLPADEVLHLYKVVGCLSRDQI